MCLKQLFSYTKWVLQVILSMIDLSNCVSVSSNFDNAFLPDCTKFCSVSQVIGQKIERGFQKFA